jgi:hypothetical protein
MALITYDGSAKDHEVIPQVLKTGSDGKPMKRKVKEPARTIYKPIGTYNLFGMLFPAGEKQSVIDKAAIKKAVSMGCFDVEIVEGEPISHDKKWLEKALQSDRVRMVGKNVEAAPAPAVQQSSHPEYSDDGLDGMKRTDLIRLATTRGLSVNLAMRKDEIVQMLRDHAAPALAEAAEEMSYDSMKDVG